MIENDMDKVDPDFANQKILDTEITWKKFNTVINNLILKINIRITSSEDKRLGTYFIRRSDLIFNPLEKEGEGILQLKAKLENSLFPEKVLKYLWDDAFKFSREEVFRTSLYICLEDIIRKFRDSEGNERFMIFKEDIFSVLLSESNIKE